MDWNSLNRKPRNGGLKVKRCCKCGLEKPFEAFHKKTASKDGRRSQCKVCRSALESESAIIRTREYRRKYPERVKVSNSRYRNKPEHKTKQAAYMKDWGRRTLAYESRYEHDCDRVLASNRLRLKRLATNGGTLSIDDRARLFNRYDNRCVSCGVIDKLIADHIVPVSKGGTSNQSNRQPLCESCNLRKGVKLDDQNQVS